LPELGELRPELLSICGVYCGLCPPYASGKCKGCYGLNKAARKPCPMYVCAAERNLKTCFLCDDFPCPTHYEKGIYREGMLNFIKKNR